MKGLRIRVPEAESSLEGLKAMGGTPISMAFTELYGALQQKVVDGQENPYSQINDSKLFEVQTYLSKTAHSIQMNAFSINDKRFTALSQEHQKILSDEANAFRGYVREYLLEAERDLEKQLSTSMKFNEVDYTAFMTAAVPMLDAYAKKLGPDAVDLLAKIKASGN
jgi:TRAP-type C4-dicarboxylate transport system substrate-binding protein